MYSSQSAENYKLGNLPENINKILFCCVYFGEYFQHRLGKGEVVFTQFNI